MILRLLNPQGLAGLAAAIALAILLLLQKVETRHWKKQSGQFEQLYTQQHSALAVTVANYRAAADAARAADQANAARVGAEQRAINERTSNDFEARLAAARAHAQRLRVETAGSAADPGAGRTAPMPGLPASPGGIAQAAGEDRLPPDEHRPQAGAAHLDSDDALTATEQAIQLDELIKWISTQARVDPNGAPRPAGSLPQTGDAVNSVR